MAENKKGFVLYADQKCLFDALPSEKAGDLIKLIFAYINDEEPETDDLVLKIAFEPIKQQLKRDLKKYEEKKVQWSEAGKRSAEARKIKKRQRSLTDVESRSTDSTVIVKVKDKVIEKESIKKSRFAPPTQEEVFEYMKERGTESTEEASRFVDFYTSNGWKVGKNPMKDWEAAVRNWLLRKKNDTRAPTYADAEAANLAKRRELLAKLKKND